MASSYPGALDALVNPVAGDPTNDPSHADQHTDANDAIEAIETTLGVNPQGTAADVAERLDDIEAAMGGGGGGSYLPLSGGVLTGELDVVSPTATPSAGARQIHYGTAPPGPSDGADGDLWINDGSVTPTAQPGLVCIKVQAFTSVTSVAVDSVFNATYDNYLLILRVAATTAINPQIRMRVAGVDATTAYSNAGIAIPSTGVYTATDLSSLTAYVVGPYAGTAGVTVCHIQIQSPALAEATSFMYSSARPTSPMIMEMFSCRHTTATAYDGFDIIAASGNMTGTVTVYGYRKAA